MSELAEMLIGGQQVVGSGNPIVSVDPSSGNVNAHLSTASAENVDAAVRCGHAALRESGWSQLLPHARADHLYRISARLLENAEPLARTVMRENGKTLRECIAQTRAAAATFRYYGAVCETLESQMTPPRGDYVSVASYEPFGVVAAIVPWNSPVTLAADKLAPALAAGNAVILKPSEITSLVSLQLGRVMLEAGLPRGLLSVLPGDVGTSSTLVTHPLVNMVSFTGGTEAGRAVARATASNLTPVVLELGGKSPNIVFADADLDLAAAGVVAGIFGSAGQSCIAGSRLFIQQSIRAKFVEKIVAMANSIRLGAPADDNTQLGPLASFGHRDRIRLAVETASRDGATVLAGGFAPTGPVYDGGAYFRPTILDDVTNESPICRNETFGPVLCVLPFSDVDDLIQQANDSDYGLACGIWTQNAGKAWHVARQISAGTVWINTYRQNSVTTPFGGVKQSGWGRERGPQGLRQFQQVKSIFLATGNKPLSLDR